MNRSNSILNRLFSNGVHSIRRLAGNTLHPEKTRLIVPGEDKDVERKNFGFNKSRFDYLRSLSYAEICNK